MSEEEERVVAIKYLSEFYSVKARIAGAERAVADPSTSLEFQIQGYVLWGNQLHFAGKYSAALTSYLEAWNLLPKLFFPLWSAQSTLLDAGALVRVDLSAQLAESSVNLLRFRDAAGPMAAVAASVQAPFELVKLNRAATGVSEASEVYSSALAVYQSGDLGTAREFAERALKAAGDDIGAQADAFTLMGAIETSEGNLDGAQGRLKTAQSLYESSGRQDGAAAAQHNLGVAFTRAGNVEEGGRFFAASASQVPFDPGWTVTHSLNPGIAAVNRPLGEGALPLMLKTQTGTWSVVDAGTSAQVKSQATVFTGSTATQLDLNAGAAEIQNKLLQPRIAADSLAELETHYWVATQFVAYLTHVAGFILPVALGDTYAALGDDASASTYYLKARDYAFLNATIERPMLWRRLAAIHLRRGNRLYRDRDNAGAQAEFENILRIRADGSFELTGPLYSGGFSALAAEHLAFLNSPDRRGFNEMDYARRIILVDANSSLSRLLANINYLGFPEDIVPIHSWRYLQNVARYFANHASQSERSYISFKEAAEKEEFTRLALEQAVDAQEAAVDVELTRLRAAQEQVDAALAALNHANTRLTNARTQRDQYAALSGKLAAIEEIVSFTNAAGLDTDIRINQNWAAQLGISAGTYDPAILLQLLTRARTRLTQQYEIANLNRQISEMTAAVVVAQRQVDVARAMRDVAEAQLEAAELKLDQAEAQLEHFNAQEFTPELWDNLAQAQREISARYLDWAIGSAFLMERAFEYDYDTDVNRIRFDYARNELNGLLAAEFLVADIDAFTFERVVETEKQVPIKIGIPLADRYPSQFRSFQQNGRLDFEILLQDVDVLHPGTCVRKLRRIEVIVEGLIGPRGLNGTLTNSGITYDRSRAGDRKARVQKPETMVLSQFDLRHDGFVFTVDEEVLALFENAGPAGGWILDFPLDSNDVDFRAITNIHFILYYDAFYSASAADLVRAEIAATAIFQQTIGLSLRHQFPDEFFALRDTGIVTFALGSEFIQFNHSNPRVRDFYLQIQSEAVSSEDLVVRVATAGGFDGTDTTDATGVIATGTATEPLNGLRGGPLGDTWTIEIPAGPNGAAFDAGFAWDRVSNLILMIDYDYTPRGRQAMTETFSADPIDKFDVVDDPGALTDAPSAWAWDAATRRVVQTSNIHDPTGPGNLNTSPARPGTYLVHKTDANWPVLDKFILRCSMNSGDTDGIGLVFRYQDVDNFYFFLVDSRRNYRRLGKKVAGAFQELQTPALDTAQGFTADEDMEVTVSVSGGAFNVYVNGNAILRGQDSSIASAGRVGFYAWANTAARFSSLEVREI
jgi:Tc toxin complex TcA C-terminal TcB-binding domain